MLCARAGGGEAVEALLAVGCAETRRRVLMAVGQQGAEAAPLAGLVAARLQDANGDVRRHAVGALDRMGASSAAVPALVACLRDREVQVREAAAAAVAPVLGAAHAGALADCLLDKSEKVRKAATKSLQQLMSTDASVAAALLGQLVIYLEYSSILVVC